MGIVTIGTVLITYQVGRAYVDVEIVAFIVIILTVFLLIVSYAIVQAFERVVRLRRQETAQTREIIRLKDQFVFFAAHELRVPANAIKWGLGSLRHKRPDLFKEEEKLLSIVERSNERLLMLVSDLLHVARIESGTITVNLLPTSLPPLIAEAEEEVRGLMQKRNILFVKKVSDTIPLVLADKARVKEVLVNLLSNAVKYNREGGTITVFAEARADGISVSISDTGVGIANEDREHVFQKFWRAANVRDVEGDGLGLFIVRQLIERMGGKIGFTSEVGKGTTFLFTLPHVR